MMTTTSRYCLHKFVSPPPPRGTHEASYSREYWKYIIAIASHSSSLSPHLIGLHCCMQNT